jgi:hypothetical protein
MATQTTITRTLVPEHQRLAMVAELFGAHFPTRIEPVVYAFADRMSADYAGGYWAFYTLGNGGFYMVPAANRRFRVACENGFEGALSADALGVAACLHAYSHLSFVVPGGFAELCSDQYYRLREYAVGHPDAGAILRATD